MQTGVVIGLVPTKPVAIKSAWALRNVTGDSCPHTTASAAQHHQCLQTHLCSEDVNGLWKAVPLTLELEALGYVLSLQGAGGVLPISFLPTGEARQPSSPILSIWHLVGEGS